MADRGARPADPGPDIGRPAAGSGDRPAAGSRATIIAAQKKTPGARPGARGSRIAASGSGVDRVNQLLKVLEGRGRLLQPA